MEVLSIGESFLAFLRSPCSGNCLSFLLNRFPQVLRDDSQRFVTIDDLFGLWLRKFSSTAGFRISATFRFVPDPFPNVFFVRKYASYGICRPVFLFILSTAYAFGVQSLHDICDRLPFRNSAKHLRDNIGFPWVDFDFVPSG